MTEDTALRLLTLMAATLSCATAIIGLVAMLKRLDGIHLSLNSRLDQLLKAAHAEGRQQERDLRSEERT